MRESNRDKTLAAGVTMVVTLLLLVVLYFGEIRQGTSWMAAASTPETGSDEELFIDPEIDLPKELPDNMDASGQPLPDEVSDAPSAPFKGDPIKSDVEQPQRIEPGKNENPASPQNSQKTQKTAPVSAPEPSVSERQRQQATSKVANAFSGKNGAAAGSSAGKGSSSGNGAGMSVKGNNINGRKFISCDKFNPELEHRVVVSVRVVVNAKGRVISAEIKSSGGASRKVVSQCLAAARSARWEEAPGTADQQGTLVFTMTPQL